MRRVFNERSVEHRSQEATRVAPGGGHAERVRAAATRPGAEPLRLLERVEWPLASGIQGIKQPFRPFRQPFRQPFSKI